MAGTQVVSFTNFVRKLNEVADEEYSRVNPHGRRANRYVLVAIEGLPSDEDLIENSYVSLEYAEKAYKKAKHVAGVEATKHKMTGGAVRMSPDPNLN